MIQNSKMKAWVLLILTTVALGDVQKTYENHRVYSVEVTNNEQFELLSKFTNSEVYDFWSPPVKSGSTNVMVAAPGVWHFEAFLKHNGFNYKLLIEDVERVFQEERLAQLLAPKTAEGKVSFTKYHRYEEILAYVRGLAKTHSNIVKVENIGKTTEGRDLVVVKISTGGTNKNTILIDGGIHAREWIAPAQVLYIIQELVENKNNTNLIKGVDWHIIPVINPDGYEHSHAKERMWRKTRSKGNSCYGVDGNRNFDWHWGEAGTSSNECSDIYRGPTAFSEPETKALRDHVLKNRQTLKLYLTFHSYGQYLLYPWSYATVLPSNSKELQSLGESVAKAIQSVNGTKYRTGTSTAFMGATAGSSDDWVMGGGNVSLSYTVELPGGGSAGFDLPPSRILGVVKETFEGVKVFHNYVEKL